MDERKYEPRRHKGTKKHRGNSVTLFVTVPQPALTKEGCFKKYSTMIKSQRKRHLQIWALWAVLIPVGIIVAWMAVPKKVTQELLQKVALASTYHTIASVEKENYKINIQVPNSVTIKHPTGWEYELKIEFINKKESEIDSLLLYKVNDVIDNNIDKQELLGRIQSKGI